uniref:Secreted protein n=1 Tax=Globodera pallida TaxID=36090 RepID=A0A183BMM2_GLOPA
MSSTTALIMLLVLASAFVVQADNAARINRFKRCSTCGPSYGYNGYGYVLVAMSLTPCSAGVAAPLRMKRQDWFSGSMMSARGAGSGGWDLFGGR